MQSKNRVRDVEVDPATVTLIAVPMTFSIGV